MCVCECVCVIFSFCLPCIKGDNDKVFHESGARLWKWWRREGKEGKAINIIDNIPCQSRRNSNFKNKFTRDICAVLSPYNKLQVAQVWHSHPVIIYSDKTIRCDGNISLGARVGLRSSLLSETLDGPSGWTAPRAFTLPGRGNECRQASMNGLAGVWPLHLPAGHARSTHIHSVKLCPCSRGGCGHISFLRWRYSVYRLVAASPDRGVEMTLFHFPSNVLPVLWSSCCIETAVFIAPLRQRLNHNCNYN